MDIKCYVCWTEFVKDVLEKVYQEWWKDHGNSQGIWREFKPSRNKKNPLNGLDFYFNYYDLN